MVSWGVSEHHHGLRSPKINVTVGSIADLQPTINVLAQLDNVDAPEVEITVAPGRFPQGSPELVAATETLKTSTDALEKAVADSPKP